MVATVNEIIKLLPEQQRIVVHLRNIEELSMEEIASVTEMSINNIRVTLSRARKSINEIYQKHFNHE
jgi:RNA polymerase sigma-70 factor (ECF subfamily)